MTINLAFASNLSPPHSSPSRSLNGRFTPTSTPTMNLNPSEGNSMRPKILTRSIGSDVPSSKTAERGIASPEPWRLTMKSMSEEVTFLPILRPNSKPAINDDWTPPSPGMENTSSDALKVASITTFSSKFQSRSVSALLFSVQPFPPVHSVPVARREIFPKAMPLAPKPVFGMRDAMNPSSIVDEPTTWISYTVGPSHAFIRDPSKLH